MKCSFRNKKVDRYGIPASTRFGCFKFNNYNLKIDEVIINRIITGC